MTQINVMSRISEDKNFFFDLLFTVYKLKQASISDIQVLFIGDIITIPLYHDLLKLTNLFNINKQVDFTKKSIRFKDLSSATKQGYFLNFTIGNFMGYSGIESINLGYKTIFYNIDKKLDKNMTMSISQSADLSGLYQMIAEIHNNQAVMDELIVDDNLRMLDEFMLSTNDAYFLKSILT